LDDPLGGEDLGRRRDVPEIHLLLLRVDLVEDPVLVLLDEVLIDPADGFVFYPDAGDVLVVQEAQKLLQQAGRGKMRLGRLSGSKRTWISLASSPDCHSRKRS
jgi:hypothetical protein